MSMQKQVVIQFKYKQRVYEIYDYPIDLNRLKEVIKQQIKPAGEIQLSWMRDPNSDYVFILGDNNLQRCFDTQINNKRDSSLEYLINLRVTDESSLSNQDAFGIQKPVDKDLSKSTQLQYPIGQRFIVKQILNQQIQQINK